ncbi:MAG: saccharopine dehydrogenase NADP-binding domain-containing protein [Cytophagales bacterium]|nr:saccharopine dehydrogenase NADP-binding domain-containing protein [Cytophaga sp.]
MQQLLILGIGRSTYYLLQYVHDVLIPKGHIIIAIDGQKELVLKRQMEFPAIQFIQSDICTETIATHIQNANLVVSMLPPAFHTMAAELCIQYNKHFFTASYVSPSIRALQDEVKQKELIFLMECGLDPGIDHMSAMSMIHSLQDKGAVIGSFESYTGGLVHPAHLNPPWNYKISWNPRNVVLAGQGNAVQYREHDTIKIVPYQRLFINPSLWKINETHIYEGYPNRDSLSYQSLYNLGHASTFIRGTLRYEGFCEGWNYLVHLGLTDDTVILPEDHNRTGRSFLNHFLNGRDEEIEDALGKLFPEENTHIYHYLETLGLLDETPLIIQAGTAAQILQSILEVKWKLEETATDRIVMIHRIQYTLEGVQYTVQSSLIVDGEDAERTAMAKTVGLPLAIAIDCFLNGEIAIRGIAIPVTAEFYKPILDKLVAFDIRFKELLVSSY